MKTSSPIVYVVCLFALGACSRVGSENPVSSCSEEGYIQVDPDVRIFYRKTGNGKQAVVVPLGFWLYEDFKSLAFNRTMIFYDMRGRGQSDFVTDTTLISIWKDVDDVEKIRQHFRLDKISLIGESYLGKMVIMYAKKYPDAVDKVVQIGAVPVKWDAEFPDSLRNTGMIPGTAEHDKVIDSLYNISYHQTHPVEFTKLWWKYAKVNLLADESYEPKMGRQWTDHLLYSNELAVNFFRMLRYHFGSVQAMNDGADDYRDVNQEVLIIHGTKDRNAPFGGAKEWAEILPNSKLLRVSGAGHVPWIENPELVLGSIDKFLRGTWPAQSVSQTQH